MLCPYPRPGRCRAPVVSLCPTLAASDPLGQTPNPQTRHFPPRAPAPRRGGESRDPLLLPLLSAPQGPAAPSPHPPRPRRLRAWNLLLIPSGLMSSLWPRVGAQGVRCCLHLLEHRPKISKGILYCWSNACRNKIRGGTGPRKPGRLSFPLTCSPHRGALPAANCECQQLPCCRSPNYQL